MLIIWTLVIGLLVGLMAKAIMPGNDPRGFIVTSFLGITGAFIAHVIGRSAGWYADGQPAGFIASVVGAIILLAGYRIFLGRKAVV